MGKIFAAVLIVTVVVIVVFQFIDPSIESAGGNAQTQLVSEDGTVKVTITGEVTRPGTYVLETNTTLDSLITVANGLTANADDLAFDTSYLLTDADSFYIAPKYDNNDVCSLEPIIKTNINKDDEESLQIVNGIGSTIAKAIVSYRSTNGEFKRIEDLKKVSGIGNATFEKIKNYVRLRD